MDPVKRNERIARGESHRPGEDGDGELPESAPPVPERAAPFFRFRPGRFRRGRLRLRHAEKERRCQRRIHGGEEEEPFNAQSVRAEPRQRRAHGESGIASHGEGAHRPSADGPGDAVHHERPFRMIEGASETAHHDRREERLIGGAEADAEDARAAQHRAERHGMDTRSESQPKTG